MGYGTIILNLTHKQRPRKLVLENVAICPDLLCNLVSFRKLRQTGIWWDTKSEPTALKRLDGTTICELLERFGQWVLNTHKIWVLDTPEFCAQPNHQALHTHKHTSSTKKPPQRATAILWHKRLGHPGPAAIEHLMQQAQGVRIKGITTVECNSCGRAKIRRQISRAPRTNNQGPGERIAIDFHSYEKQSYNKELSQLLITDKYSRFQWDFYLKDNRTAKSIIKILTNFVKFLQTQYNITPKVVETDNEIATVKPEVMRWLQAQGIAAEPSAPDTQAQNGGAERSGGVNKEKARAMRLDANLPWELWPEITRAAVYLYNRTPNYVNQWKTPYEVFFTHASQTNGIATSKKPRVAHLKAYGCKAFAMTDDTHRGKSRLQRLDPKAWIGYLVGYQASTIYRIWIPSLAKVISTRDVIFDENTIFDGKTEDLIDSLMHSTLLEIAAYVRTIELPPPIPDTGTESFHEDDTINTTEEINESEDPPGYYMGRKIQEHYPTPPATPPPVALLAQLMSGTAETTPEIQSSKTVPWAAAFMAGTEAGSIGDHNGSAIDKAQLRRLLSKGVKIHQSQLPEPPTARSNLDEHLMGELFKEA
jgi:transposase InsO family protein